MYHIALGINETDGTVIIFIASYAKVALISNTRDFSTSRALEVLPT